VSPQPRISTGRYSMKQSLKLFSYTVVVFILLVAPLALFLSINPANITQAAVTTFYISPSGSDSGDGTKDSPWETIAFAIPQLQPGDTLYARGGTYSGQQYYWSSPSGTSGSPITFAAYPGETPIFDGQGANMFFLVLRGPDWIVIDGLTIKNYRPTTTGVIWMGRPNSTSTNFAEHITIRNNHIENSGSSKLGHAIYVSWGNRNIVIENNFIKKVSGWGISGYHAPGADGLKIINNIIRDAQTGGITLADVTNIEIRQNILYNNGQGIKFELGGGVKNAVVTNNLIVNSASWGLRIATLNFDDVFSDVNLYFNNKPTAIRWGGQSKGLAGYRSISDNADNSIEADPLFVDHTRDDFRHKPFSGQQWKFHQVDPVLWMTFTA